MEESYCLRWNSFTNNFVDVVEDLYTSKFMTDAYLFCDGVKYDELQKLIEFMYKGEINVSEDNLSSLLKAADALKIKGLSNISLAGIKSQQKYSPGKETECLQPSTKKRKSPEKTSNGGMEEESSPTKKESPHQLENEDIPESSDDDGLVIDELSYFEVKEEDSMYPDVRLEEGTIDGMEINDPQPSQEANPSSPSSNVAIESDKSYSSFEHRSGTGNPTHKIPRPPNAFMVFANEWRKKLAMDHPGESNKDISVRLGSLWKNMDQVHKDKYFYIASEMALEHRRKYPFYVYSPKEARLRKALRAQHRLSDCTKLSC